MPQLLGLWEVDVVLGQACAVLLPLSSIVVAGSS